MAWPIPPQTFHCASGCGWKTTTDRPVGDCRVPGHDHLDACPRCGASVQSRNASALEQLDAQLRLRLRRLGGRR